MNSDLHVREIGSGPAVVFLHAGVVDGEAWLPAAQRVADSGFRAIVPDLRGYGKSPDPTAPFTHAGDIIDLMDSLGLQEADIVGWSMGGGVATTLAVQHPNRVHSLALCNTVPPGFERHPDVIASWEQEDALWTSGDLEALVELDVMTWAVGPERTAEQTPTLVKSMVKETTIQLLERYKEEFDEFEDRPKISADDVCALQCPLLLIDSDCDFNENLRAAIAIKAAIPNAQYVSVSGCAHLGPIEMPDEYAGHLIRFLYEA